MSKKRAYLLIFIAVVAGFLAGGFIVQKWYQRSFFQFAADSSAAELGKDNSLLVYLRSGHTNSVMDLLEIDLDGQMLSLQTMLSEIPESQRETNDVHLLERARAYRAAHPTNGLAM